VWNSERPDAAVLDYSLPDGNSLDLLTRWKAVAPEIPVIILTGNSSIELAVQAIKLGAEQFLTKPADLGSLHKLLQRSIESERNRKNKVAGGMRESRKTIDPFWGKSPAIRRLAEIVRKVADADSPILITGETGSGKGILARWIHQNSSRSAETFVDLNCGGLSHDLFESELFGHEKGAFTGAVQAKPGLLEIAHKGTVFLDEIGDIDSSLQPRLLKAIEEKRFRRVGAVHDRSVDIRLITATHRDIPAAVRDKRFREDLYFRICTITLTIPPLRERIEDLPVLATWILKRLSEEMGRGPYQISPEGLTILLSYSWPGNIRELRNVLERGVLLCEGNVVTPRELDFVKFPKDLSNQSENSGSLKSIAKEQIENALELANWKIAEASTKLGIARSTLYQKIKEYDIHRR
jgi:DNA-binding NtrC family response regulator